LSTFFPQPLGNHPELFSVNEILVKRILSQESLRIADFYGEDSFHYAEVLYFDYYLGLLIFREVTRVAKPFFLSVNEETCAPDANTAAKNELNNSFVSCSCHPGMRSILSFHPPFSL
jgi:hypothetical protein